MEDEMGMMFRVSGEAETLLLNPPLRCLQGWTLDRQGPGCYSTKPRATLCIIVDLKHHLKKAFITAEGKTQKP